MIHRSSFLIAVAIAVAAYPSSRANAFCGFYVSGSSNKLYANATMVVMMREGTRTVLSMQNNYQGPLEDFSMVIPVPTVLRRDDVRTLSPTAFATVDALGGPRLVEYWEANPCGVSTPPPSSGGFGCGSVSFASRAGPSGGGAYADSGVRIEDQFMVGEYDIVILSADDSSLLESWLRENAYHVPEGAATALAPYVAQGMKFFVAKVDSSQVRLVNGQAALSPLRFRYDSPDFSLPIRLGLINTKGSQDLIVNILAPNTRYEVANRSNLFVPTNFRVNDEVRYDFAAFYEALFDRTVAMNPDAVVTEYAWPASSSFGSQTGAKCDPCPPGIEGIDSSTIAALGADALPSNPSRGDFVLTRLHYRYTASSMGGDDLVFRAAGAVSGGRGEPRADATLDQTVTVGGSTNTFQARYAILHAWTTASECEKPVHGSWGGSNATFSQNTALAGRPPEGGNLERMCATPVPSLNVRGTPAPQTVMATVKGSGCSCTVAPSVHGTPLGPTLLLALAGLTFVTSRRYWSRTTNADASV